MATKKRITPEVKSNMYKQEQQTEKSQLPLILSVLALVATVYNFSKVQTLEKTLASAPKVEQQAPEPKADLSKIPDVGAGDWYLGSKDAQLVMVEYSDYECPFCQRFHPTVQQVMKDYGGKVAWVFRQYPLPFHPFAQKSAEAAECVGKIGGNEKFWQFTDKAFELGSKDKNALAVDGLVKIAADIGVDSVKVRACITSGETAEKVKADMEGGSAGGVTGTPGTILIAKNGQRGFVPGAYPVDQVKAQIDALLK